MTHDQVIAKLLKLKLVDGWAVRNGKIVVWENAEPVPNELSDCVELDNTADN